jgi:hypothetical protein
MAEFERRIQRAAPADDGHRGSFTRPEDLLIEPDPNELPTDARQPQIKDRGLYFTILLTVIGFVVLFAFCGHLQR